VIAEAEFIELVQAELEGVRRTAIRLDRQQAELEERAQDPEQSGEQTARMQAGVSQRIRAQDAMLRKLAERTERNNLDDEPMRRLLENAAEIAGRAGEASERAAEELGERRREEAAQAQRRVRDELARLVDQLDRGQDGWVARRNLERLLSDEQAVRERTRELARRTVGRELGELTPDERTELERIADRQRELAQRARDAADELSRSADELRENDPTQASAMDRAAEQAAREALAEKLEEAAEDIAQNRSANAGRLQEQSIEAMQGMLEELENAQRRRDEALRRELASTIATIESLIRQQEAAIASLDEPEPDAELERRLHANTLGAEAETRASFPELASVADLLARAADAQARAIGAIRAGEIDAALNAETESLARLSEALEEARRQDEQAAQREQDRKRRELREAYRDALAQQNALRDETGELAGHEPNRRRRARLRDVGQRQEGLRTDIEAIPERHEAGDIGVISLFHRRIDGALTEAVRSLGRGRGDEGVLARQSEAAAMLKAIVETLSEPPGGQDDEFRNAGGGGGGGGGAGGGDQPVVADLQQLKLLRALQAIVLDQTRAAPGSVPATALAQTQRDIATQARALIERADRNPEPGAPESPSEPPEGP
jgi:hypothetical protein